MDFDLKTKKYIYIDFKEDLPMEDKDVRYTKYLLMKKNVDREDKLPNHFIYNDAEYTTISQSANTKFYRVEGDYDVSEKTTNFEGYTEEGRNALKVKGKATPKPSVQSIYKRVLKDNFEGHQFITNVKSYLQFILDIVEDKNHTYYFRGVSDFSYKDFPSMFRGVNILNEDKMYKEFFIKFANSLKEKNYLETLTTMQHFGLPTRLLDVTTNPLVALYMVCKYSTETFKSNVNYPGEVRIYKVPNDKIKYYDSDKALILGSLPLLSYVEKEFLNMYIDKTTNPKKPKITKVEESAYKKLLRSIKKESPSFVDEINVDDLKENVFVKVGLINERVTAQSGSFILFGLTHNDTDIELYQLDEERLLIQNANEILSSLDKLNINDSTMFPDMTNTAEYIKNKY